MPAGRPPVTASSSLADATIELLRRHPPFDAMESEALRFLAQHLRLGYHPSDSVVLSPEDGEVRQLFIVQRGTVRLRQPHLYQTYGERWLTLRQGELFSVGALLERRAVSGPYVAVEDTFCYRLGRDDFDALLRRSPEFHAHCTRYVTSLLAQSRRLLQIQYSGYAGEQQAMNAPLRAIRRREPVSCAPELPIGDALRSMKAQKIGSIVVVDAAFAPIGIFTHTDVLDRVALAQTDLAHPIASVMTPDPVTLPADARVWDAALAMARRGCRHVVIVEEGRLQGVVTERDLFALSRVSMRQISRTISVARDIGEWQQAAADIRRLATSLQGQGVAAEALTSIISALNDALTSRILEVERDRRGLAGVEWCWLAFGSEGRLEQTLASDQDNGLVFRDPGSGETGLRERLLALAATVNRMLDRCGYPLCKGNIMAGNPELCLPLSEWARKFEDWIRNPDPEALLNASIFFDFRPLYGATALADALRERLIALTTEHPGFLRMMAQNALRVAPPLGMLRDFVVDADGANAGTLDLKGSGARLFIDAARIFALGQGVAHTGTAQRLLYAGARMKLSPDEISSAVDAFYFIQQLRLRNQQTHGEAPERANRIDPGELNEVDRRILKEALRQARRLQSRLALDYRL